MAVSKCACGWWTGNAPRLVYFEGEWHEYTVCRRCEKMEHEEWMRKFRVVAEAMGGATVGDKGRSYRRGA